MARPAGSDPPARGQRWLSAFGLRGQIAAAILVTAVTVLAVAAIVLLGPIEHSLRKAEQTTLTSQVPASAGSAFRSLDPSYAYYADTYTSKKPNAEYLKGKSIRAAIMREERAIGSPINASLVALLGDPRTYGAYRIAAWPDLPASDPLSHDRADDAALAFAARPPHAAKPIYSIGTIGDVQYARAAIPFLTRGPAGERQRWVLIVRKSLVEVNSAVGAVRTAFLIAALVALGLTLILGIPLSGRIVRRLRRLRQAALQLATQGPPVDVPVDRARDEVGDLARTFATMQEQLRQQEEARRAFVATASHELRTPLASLDGMLELLDEDLQSNDPDLNDAQELLDRARAQSKRLGRLAADLLDLSRIDAQVDLRSEPVELGELSRAVLAEFELGTSERGVGTILDDAAGPVWALGDPGSVARILRILLDNAVRLSPEGSNVTVEVRNEDSACITVCDDGPGVPPDEREVIFERFTRGRQTAAQAGFGLGLAIGRELAERMGGELVLEERDGPGSRFTFRLPVARAPEFEPVAAL